MTIKKLIETELTIHPKAKTVDYYKMFYQAVFGPAHILQNTQNAYQYLIKEIAVSKDNVSIQNICFMKNDFIRVDLGLIKDAKIFFNILMESARMQTTKPSAKEWLEIWHNILKKLKEYKVKNFANDSEKLEKELKSGIFVFHHSEIYKNLYNPHYRVVSKRLWENI